MGKSAKVRPELTGQKTPVPVPVPVDESDEMVWKIVPLDEIEDAEIIEPTQFLPLEDYITPDEARICVSDVSLQDLKNIIRTELTLYHRSRQLRQKIEQRAVEVSRGIAKQLLEGQLGETSNVVVTEDIKIAMRVETNTYHRSMQLREKIDRCSREVAEKVFSEKSGKTRIKASTGDGDETKRIVRDQIADYHHSPLLKERIEKLAKEIGAKPVLDREAELHKLFEEYRATEMLSGRLQERVEEVAAETTAREFQKVIKGLSHMVRKIVQESFEERARKDDE